MKNNFGGKNYTPWGTLESQDSHNVMTANNQVTETTKLKPTQFQNLILIKVHNNILIKVPRKEHKLKLTFTRNKHSLFFRFLSAKLKETEPKVKQIQKK